MGVRSTIDRLRQIRPKSGRVITESGEVANAADFMRTQNAVNDLVRAGLGRVASSHRKITLSAGQVAYFKQSIPAGTSIRGILGGSSIINGEVESRLVIGATPGVVVDTLDPMNADRRTINQQNPAEDAFIQQLDGFTSGIELDLTVGYSEGQGDRKLSTTLTGNGIGGIFDSTVEPYFSFENLGDSSCEIIVRFVWADISEVLDHVR